MRYLASACTVFLINKGVISVEDRELYEYGFDITMYTVFSTCGLLLIGSLYGQIWNTVVLISIFYTCQSSGGGYHASTHLRCFLGMCLGLCVALHLLQLPIPMEYYYCIGVMAIVILFHVPLVLHANKRYLVEKWQTLVNKSVSVTGISIIITVIIVYLSDISIKPFIIGYMMAAISRGYAKIAMMVEKCKLSTK